MLFLEMYILILFLYWVSGIKFRFHVKQIFRLVAIKQETTLRYPMDLQCES